MVFLHASVETYFVFLLVSENWSSKRIFNTKWSTEKWPFFAEGMQTSVSRSSRKRTGVWTETVKKVEYELKRKPDPLLVCSFNDSLYEICFDLHQKMNFGKCKILKVFTLKLKLPRRKVIKFFSKSAGLLHWNQACFSSFFFEIKDITEWITLGNVFKKKLKKICWKGLKQRSFEKPLFRWNSPPGSPMDLTHFHW